MSGLLLGKWICKTVDPSFAATPEPLAHGQNVANLSLFYKYYSGICSSELPQLIILIDYTIFLSPIPRCYKDKVGTDFRQTNFQKAL